MKLSKSISISLLSIIYIVCFYHPLSVPLFVGAEGVYSVTYGGCSSGKTESFYAEQINDFFKYSDIDGQSLYTENLSYVNDFLTEYDCRLVFSEVFDGLVVKYYYTPKISVYRSINGKKVNIQTADRDGGFTIGSPLIYGGY